MFTTKIQGLALGRIISSRTLSAMKKDVTQHMYGGDITRKMKLREKQKKGKKKMMERGKGNVNIPQDVFIKMMRSEWLHSQYENTNGYEYTNEYEKFLQPIRRSYNFVVS